MKGIAILQGEIIAKEYFKKSSPEFHPKKYIFIYIYIYIYIYIIILKVIEKLLSF
jgi:hypothetical protein